MRVHWATFDANDSGAGSGTYNEENCKLAEGVLNANVRKLNDGEMPARFWCEEGRFHA